MGTVIKKIKIGSQNYDIDATFLGGRSASDWEDLIDAHLNINGPYISSQNPSSPTIGFTTTTLYKDVSGGQAPEEFVAGAQYKDAIYLFDPTSAEVHYEYVVTGIGTTKSPYLWTFVGTSATDLQNYVKNGTYTTADGGSGTTGAAVGNTGNYGSDSPSTSSSGGQTALGHISSAFNTENASAGTVNGSNFSFTGTQKQITLTQAGTRPSDYQILTATNPSYTPEGTIGGSASIGSHSHTVNTATAIVVSTITKDTRIYAVTSLTVSSTADAVTSMTVDENGILSFSQTSVVTALNSDRTLVLPNINASTTTVVTGATLSKDGSATVQGSNFSFSGTSKSVGDGSVKIDNIYYTPQGTIGGTQVLGNHNHSISASSTNVISVAVASHTHAVNSIPSHSHSLNSHTHSIGNHTHNITL